MPYPRYTPGNEEDPELAAEREIDLQNGIAPSKENKNVTSNVDVPKSQTDGEEGKSTTPTSGKLSFKEAKASRKKRSRGISGSSIKKDGGKFDLGMENFDTFDDVSEQEDVEDYRTYEKYLSDQYSSYSNDIGSESDCGSHLDNKPHPTANPQVSAVVSALLASFTDPVADGVGFVAELLMEEYDEAGRTRILELAFREITDDITSVTVSNPQCEYHLVLTVARLIGEGLLNRVNVAAYLENSPNDDHPVHLLKAALDLANEGDLHGDSKQKPPSSIASLARDLCKESDTCEVATKLSSLKLPYYHSHFVYQVCVEAITTVNMDSIFYVTGALRDMLDHKTLAQASVRIGFARLFESMQELEVDLPGATSLGTLLVSYAANDYHLLDEELYAKCPKPKRFLLKKDSNSGKLTVLGMKEGDVDCDTNNYFIMQD